MGCQMQDSYCSDSEKPRHQVNVTSFGITQTEITPIQYKTVTGSNPSHFYLCGADCPVDSVNWSDAKSFCEAVGGHLPSEAQWEYAARGGKSTIYPCGDSSSCLNDYAWHGSNGGDKTHLNGGKFSNDFGLYDMLGNVWEWIADGWNSDYNGAPTDGSVFAGGDGAHNCIRGGSYADVASDLRASARFAQYPSVISQYNGFRCVK